MAIFVTFFYIPIVDRRKTECLAGQNFQFYVFTILKINHLNSHEHNFMFKRNLFRTLVVQKGQVHR